MAYTPRQIPHPTQDDIVRLAEAQIRLRARLGRDETEDEMAAELGVHVDIVREWMHWLTLAVLEQEAQEQGLLNKDVGSASTRSGGTND